jgi:ubiquinone/menaquinone biosynthesis C-methylase UbiE
MHKNWIYEQTNLNIAQFDKAMETYYPQSKTYIYDPQKHIGRICEQCNYLSAIKQIDWLKYFKNNYSIMDIGCGGGWLTAFLSKIDNVSTIYALDSSKHYLFDLIPKVVKIMEGKYEKIVLIEALFTPLLFSEGFLDAVVASSSLHHADNLEVVLKEIRRVLKKGGYLFVLNETPATRFQHLVLITKAIIKIFKNLLFCSYKQISPSVSSSGYLYDPYLGDRNYSFWYWKIALQKAGFSIIEHIDTGLPTVKNGCGPNLEHIICKAI